MCRLINVTRHCLVALSCFGFLIASSRAEDSTPPSDAVVLQAVARSLPFLEKEGVAWMHERDCISCHHVPFLLWSHRAAQSRGLTVDARKLAEWDEWTRQDSLSHRNLFRLQNYDLGKVEATKLPDAVKEKLKPLIEQPFKTEAEFLAKLTPLLSSDELTSCQAIILKTAERAPFAVDRTGGGLDVLGQLLFGNHGTASVLVQAEFRDGVIDLMKQTQLEDGSWTPGNQFATMRRWPLPTANQTTTMWATLALAASEAPGQKPSTTVEKAVAYQRQQPSNPDNREWLATRLLFEHQFGTAADVTKLLQQLIEAKNSDGGWGWEKGLPSDSLTTGLALYVLAKARAGDDSAVFREARKLLLSTQQSNGSWLTPSKNITKSVEPERLKARDEIYHYWGTAWAAIGLLESVDKPGN
ncbi:MAG: prenyltransferase/squalene oxidase repeat-containing protein [Planctomycetota bacterium]